MALPRTSSWRWCPGGADGGRQRRRGRAGVGLPSLAEPGARVATTGVREDGRPTLQWSGPASAHLMLSGTRTEPHAQALAAAREVKQAFASWRPAIEQALFDTTSLTPKRSPRVSFCRPAAFPRIAAPGDVWSHVSLVFVSVTPLSGLLTTELGYTTDWDDEHTLGARFQSGRFIELCGSVLRP